MAVEVNKRKRKHETDNPQEDDDGAEVIPKKQSKKSLTPKKEKKPNKKQANLEQDVNAPADEPGEELAKKPKKEKKSKIADAAVEEEADEDMDDSQQDSGFDAEEKDVKFSKDFKMLHFRTKLRGANFITELRHFLHICESRPKMIGKYIEKRGKPLELAEALERVDKTNVLHMAYICEALQMVIMEILSNQRSHMESAVSASRYFLKSHGPIVELLLKSAQFNHRKVALKLLTAIVCVEPQLGRQVLSSYDILSNVTNITQFLSHSQFEVQQQQQQNNYPQKDSDYETVRKCFIHFVLSYLVDGNTLLIRNILDRGSIIRALAAGLLYDDALTVCVVLNTLKKFVLECADISKTKKIHVFDLDCCKSFVQLYDWQGPKVFAAQQMDKKGKPLAFNKAPLINSQEKESVAKSVHEFLLILLTSRKWGITFDSIKFFRQKHNTIQGQIIGYLHAPWSNVHKTDLVIKILESCPDLFRNTIRNYAGIVNPLRTAPRFWVQACEFLTKIISTCHPMLLKGASDKITLTDFSFWIKDICLPLEALVHIDGNKILLHKNYHHRLAINHLLLAMFKQYTNYMQVIAQREHNKGSNSLRRFKFDILNHLLLNFPTMENILQSLNISILLKDTEEVDVLAHLDVALDLVLIVCQENRTFVNKTTVILDYLELLRPLYAHGELEHEVNGAPGTELDKSNIKLEMKAIKTILLLFPKALEPEKERFSSVLKSFVKAFVYGEPDISREAGALLRGIFKNTGIFESGELEIDLWLEALKFFDDETVDVVAQVFNEVLKVTKANVEAPKSLDSNANTGNLQTLFDNIEKGLSVQAYVETLSISKLMPLIYKGVEIEQPLSDYLEVVCFLMYHYYPSAEYVVNLYDKHFTTLKPYMENWLSHEQHKYSELFIDAKSAKLVPKLKEVQDFLLHGSFEFEQIFESKSQDVDIYEVEFKGNMLKFTNHLRNERMLMIYIQHVLFGINQLQEKQMLTKEQALRGAEFINNCLEMIVKCEIKPEFVRVDDDENDIDRESFLNKILKYIYGVKLQSIKSNELFTPSKDLETYTNYLLFLKNLTDYCQKLDGFDVYSENFKLKLVKAVAISLNAKEATIKNSENLEEFLQLLKVFNLGANHCLDILNLMVDHLTYKDFFQTAVDNQKTIYYSLMQNVLQSLASLKKSIKCENFIKKFSKLYCNFFKKLQGDFNVEALEEAFFGFLQINHQYILELDGKFFETFFKERKLTKASIRLASLLFERDDKLNDNFLLYLEENMDKKELMYPLMELAFKKQLNIEAGVLQKIYQNYKNGFMRTIEKPLKAGAIYKEHVDTSLHLIGLCMPLTECRDFCNKQFKFEHIEIYQLRTIYKIYEKAIQNVETPLKATIFVNYIMLQVQMLALDLKMQKLNQDKLELIAYQLQQWFKYGWELNKASAQQTEGEEEKEPKEFSPDFSKLLKSQQWLQFCKSCLKFAMHISESDMELETTDKFNGLLLKLLAFLGDNLYSDFDEQAKEYPYITECSQLYEMIFTHSKFYDIVLTKTHVSWVKTQVLHLLFVLAKKSPSCLQATQVPAILGAYQARLHDSDRYCLALLNLFEFYDCGLSQYRPFIWGESAIAFYALKAADEERAKLTQQETSITQVMSLVDRQLCEYTIENFPVWRKLDTLQQLPELEFENPFTKAWLFGANSVEQKLELGLTDIPESEMRLCPKRPEIFEQCYDPAFFVPLMSMCFSNEAYAHPARPVQNGLLALTFAALSSQDKEMRQAAGCVQLRYRGHFENSKFYEKPLWIQTYENIQSGLNDLRNSWMKHKANSGTPRVPYISGLFVAKTFNLTTDPTHLLYKQLTMYLRLKSSFNFQCIPEFNVLFYSPEVEHQEFRQFIVEVIKHGIKSSSDLFLLVTTNTFKVLMGFYGSTMSTLDLNLQILSVFSTCVKIPASSKIMIDHIGLIPWLSSIVSSIEFYQFDVIEGLISIINNLWYAVKANEKEFHNFSHIILELHRLILQLLPLISPRISVSNFSKLMNILNKTSLQSTQYLALSPTQLTKIISCAEKHFGSLILPIESIYENGGMGCSSTQDYCKELFRQQQVENKSILPLSSLRSYVISWWSAHNAKQANNSTALEIINETLVEG